ncbi:MAG: lysostaphin resistance A-like protein [Ktedonobacterales bacterium]
MILQQTKLPNNVLRPPSERVSGRRLLLAIGLIFLLSGSVGAITYSLVHAIDPTWIGTVDFVVLVVALVYASVTTALLIAFGGPRGLRGRLGFRFTSGGDLLLAVGVDLLCAVAVVLVYFLLTPVFGPPETRIIPILKAATDVTRLPSADPFTLIMIFVRVLVLVALGEELLFRGALYGWLRQHLPAVPTILLTALAFSCEHIYPGMPVPAAFSLVPLAFIFGVGAGCVRERTGSTLNTAVMHVLVDSSLLITASLLILR